MKYNLQILFHVIKKLFVIELRRTKQVLYRSDNGSAEIMGARERCIMKDGRKCATAKGTLLVLVWYSVANSILVRASTFTLLCKVAAFPPGLSGLSSC